MVELRKAIAHRLTSIRDSRDQGSIAELSELNVRTLRRLEKDTESFPQIDTLARYLNGLDMTLGEFFAPWIRPGTTDYDRECHELLLQILSNPKRRGSLKNLLKALAEDKL